VEAGARARRLLVAVAFLTFFDRALLPALLPVVADDLDVTVDVVGRALIGYVVAYAAAQLLWSVVSIRIGRVRVLAISTALGAVGLALSALAVDPTMLIVARTLSGAALGATVPAVLTYFGDSLALKERAVATANLAAGLSLGMTVGTLGGAAIGDWLHWRVAFVVAMVLAGVVTVLLVRIPEPPARESPRFWASLGVILGNRWSVGVLLITVLEGALLIGVLNYLPTALVDEGVSVALAGLATATFGIAVIAFSQLLKPLIRRRPSWLILLLGGIAAVLGFAILTLSVTIVTVGVAAILLGASWAFAHTQMQTWMTDAAIDARPVGMALFAVALFGGGSIGTAAGNAAAAGSEFGLLFAGATLGAAVFTIVAVLARARYATREH
jgi:predicted MFS family arabinose efflux permease